MKIDLLTLFPATAHGFWPRAFSGGRNEPVLLKSAFTSFGTMRRTSITRWMIGRSGVDLVW